VLPSVASSVANVPVSVGDVPVEVLVPSQTAASSVADVEVEVLTLAGIVADVPVAVSQKQAS